MKTAAITPVNNVPDYAKDTRFWVVTRNEDEFWFYGAWDDEKRAKDVAKKIEGYVLMNIKYI